jgi:hypothetical protein
MESIKGHGNCSTDGLCSVKIGSVYLQNTTLGNTVRRTRLLDALGLQALHMDIQLTSCLLFLSFPVTE